MFGEKHKKEMPILGMLGLGGGVGSNLVGGGVAPDGTMKFAMFGGGGSGGAWLGMGGGGGGYIEEDEDFSKDVAYPFSVGAAGATPGPGPSTPGANRGNSGGNTTFTTNSGVFTAYGGGGGGAINPSIVNNRRGIPGGSGGGGFDPASPPGEGLGNMVTGTTNPAQASPPQPKTLSRVQGYNGGNGAAGDGTGSGGGGAGGAGTGASVPTGGPGGSAVTITNFGPHNGDGVMTNETAKNATGYANGGGGVREAGYPGGAATAGLLLIRVPDAFDTSLSNPSGANQVVTGGYRYIRLTQPGTITFVDA